MDSTTCRCRATKALTNQTARQPDITTTNLLLTRWVAATFRFRTHVACADITEPGAVGRWTKCGEEGCQDCVKHVAKPLTPTVYSAFVADEINARNAVTQLSTFLRSCNNKCRCGGDISTPGLRKQFTNTPCFFYGCLNCASSWSTHKKRNKLPMADGISCTQAQWDAFWAGRLSRPRQEKPIDPALIAAVAKQGSKCFCRRPTDANVRGRHGPKSIPDWLTSSRVLCYSCNEHKGASLRSGALVIDNEPSRTAWEALRRQLYDDTEAKEAKKAARIARAMLPILLPTPSTQPLSMNGSGTLTPRSNSPTNSLPIPLIQPTTSVL